jgi:endonuclease/exonuclease/phosphatase family metal-dependent hydrolase
LVNYNASGAVDVDSLSAVIHGLRPDVVCLTESGSGRAVRRIARRSGLHVAARAGRGRTAVAILAGERIRVLSHSTHDLAAPEGTPRRTAALAILGLGALRFAVMAFQFGLRPEVRAMNAADVETVLAKVEAPVVVAGDLNETPAGAAAQRFAEVLQDAFAVAGEGRGETYPNPEPSARRDIVYLGRDLEVLRCWVPSAAPVGVASHHRPVCVEFAGRDDEEAHLTRTAEPAA